MSSSLTISLVTCVCMCIHLNTKNNKIATFLFSILKNLKIGTTTCSETHVTKKQRKLSELPASKASTSAQVARPSHCPLAEGRCCWGHVWLWVVLRMHLKEGIHWASGARNCNILTPDLCAGSWYLTTQPQGSLWFQPQVADKFAFL